MASEFTIRTATVDDAPVLLEIYAPFVTDTVVTSEYVVPTLENFTARITSTLERYPYLVAADENGTPIGYAYASRFRERAAYGWSVELSIYVSPKHHKKGVGRALYTKLEDILRKQNVLSLNASVFSPNPASIEFHRHMGYKEVGHFERSAYKAGQWLDVVWMEKLLDEPDGAPEPFIPFPEL